MNIYEQLKTIVRENPSHPAYIFDDQVTTYEQFLRKVNDLASGLTALGYKKGDHLALISWNSPYFLVTMYAALKIGAVLIPINPMYTPNEMKYILKNGDVKAIIALDTILKDLEAISHELSFIKHIIFCPTSCNIAHNIYSFTSEVYSFVEVVRRSNGNMESIHIEEDDPAIILYTSGTTGHPKGTILSQRSVYYGAKSFAEHFCVTNKDRMITALPMFHVFSLTVAVNGPLIHGATLLLMEKFSPNEVFRLAKTYEATLFAGVPTMYSYLLQNETDHQTKRNSFQTIRYCASGGAPFPVKLIEEFEKTFQVPVIEGYGLTEAAPVSFNPLTGPRKYGSIGVTVPYMDAIVVDEYSRPLEHGKEGELIIRGKAMMTAYYNEPEETVMAMKDGWFYTGDMAVQDEDGYFYIKDRKKDVIIVNGYNVYPREVEEVLYRHPNVLEVAIIGGPHPDSGEEVIACVVVNDRAVTESILSQYCKRYLTEYKVPNRFIFMDELPRNTTGKMLKSVLKDYVESVNEK